MASQEIRPIRVEGNLAFITLTQGYEAVIDAADVPLVEGFNWYAVVARRLDGTIWTVYAARSEPRQQECRPRILLHRALLGAPDGVEGDHQDGDGLNNRRSNLRLATVTQNRRNARKPRHNTSGIKGVHWSRGKWRAEIKVNGKSRYLGRFSDLSDAALAYAKASAELHGDFGNVG